MNVSAQKNKSIDLSDLAPSLYFKLALFPEFNFTIFINLNIIYVLMQHSAQYYLRNTFKIKHACKKQASARAQADTKRTKNN